MRIAVPTETVAGERRVAIVPDTVARLRAAGLDVSVQTGAGVAASYPDAGYGERGADLVPDADELLAAADAVLKVAPPTSTEVGMLRPGAALLGFLDPFGPGSVLDELADRGVTAFAVELLPRISRAQGMDALSSQALVAGYRAVLIAAGRLPRFFPMSMTAAGTVPPAKVLVLGTGVAGLQAIATARRLGAVVEAYDVRAAAKEEVMSLGATFVELPLETQDGTGGYAREQSDAFLREQRKLIGRHVSQSDVVITTAAVPGARAPLLVTEAMVAGMRPGSVLVDLAAESGGNCELTRAGADVEHAGVVVSGPLNLASGLPAHASALYARNLANLLLLMVRDGEFGPDGDDAIVAGTCVTRDGSVVHPMVLERRTGRR